MALRTGIAAIASAIFLSTSAMGPGVAHGQPTAEQRWHLAELGVPAAHRVARGEGVVVAVVDSGVDDAVPDLAGALLPGAGFGSAEGTDGTRDAGGHGTAMAALIAGRGVPGGVLGVAPAARVLPVSVGADGARFTTEAVAAGITWAVDQGADVVNLSLTTEAAQAPELVRAVDHAFEHDVVVVAGTGNAGVPRIGAPANVRGVVAVAGTRPGGLPWPSSNTGPETVLAAPAEGVVTALPRSVPGSGFAAVDGTSAAAALVSGVAALVRSRYPGMDAGNVVNRLIATAVDLGGTGRDDTTGFGLVDAAAAVDSAVAPVERNPLAPPPRTTTPPAASAPPPAGDSRATGPGPVAGDGIRVAVALGGLFLGVVSAVVAGVLPARRKRPPATRPPPADGSRRR
ncbi:S8 family serine peptidase [Saccharothrix algeriensis]|uniref:Type VII secretion-associated serine protease mycosin n=1 Tax=Saccharothrix algeriensis TaxID=173560 RepID=A0ABS2S7P5_9PSEU|nr:S8 family serine peptidase [Saccharothrix algeriensis]MBM7812268.1 type VII secretion-associated serine protease mycosin [Saccharothrix algeriensis]